MAVVNLNPRCPGCDLAERVQQLEQRLADLEQAQHAHSGYSVIPCSGCGSHTDWHQLGCPVAGTAVNPRPLENVRWPR